MNQTIDTIVYIFFYIFPVIALFLGTKIKPNLGVFPFSIKIVDVLTPYLLLSSFIQTELVGFENVHYYFYIGLSFLGIIHASYLTFVKRSLSISRFFRTWWRYVFLLTFFYHFIIGGYGLYKNIF